MMKLRSKRLGIACLLMVAGFLNLGDMGTGIGKYWTRTYWEGFIDTYWSKSVFHKILIVVLGAMIIIVAVVLFFRAVKAAREKLGGQ